MKNGLRSTVLFQEAAPLIERMGLILVDITESQQHRSNQIRVVIKAPGRITTIEDCVKVHKALEPRLALTREERDLHLEVSTPGLQRLMKDLHELEVFTGEQVKIYDERVDDWLQGRLEKVDENSVYLSEQDAAGRSEMKSIPLKSVKKAKLDAFWEEKR